jgi:penicillin amidase
MLSKTDDLTVETMMAIQNDAHDKAAEVFVPVLLSVLRRIDAWEPFSKRVIQKLEEWDFVADLDAIGPVIWLRWLQHYRAAVWDDEWEPRGIKKRGGSWGFTGNNRREPMLEVLEYITREHPNSIWFDDRRTPERESRDEIALRSFHTAVASLKKEFSNGIDRWTWKRINVLRIPSLSRQEAMARTGGPVSGTCFTVNPGGNIGHVGGGASWRMIVDFGRTGGSVGVYPGGQSEDPTSEHYDDQIELWARGRYVPLRALADASELPDTAKVKTITFVP